ncbi:MAG: hypothetical protein HYZ11_18950 [Candidatus Tectomicrobia bacterium]|uniref:Uncharacterized protein n=1 Tax=Tectimicrobiota bacterium TaxID=2528274 RepID=A0A932I1L1_UNCTE|nr:hypothetical protein [Candidatus Tectomicrobia bacterium]
MSSILGDWDFLQPWWWEPILAPVLGLLALAGLAAVGAGLYFLAARTTRLQDYREALRGPEEEGDEPPLPEDVREIQRWMERELPEVSEEEIDEMEAILERSLAEDIHPDMRREIEKRGIPVRLMDLPTPETVKDVGYLPTAIWHPAMNAIEIYAALVKDECGRDRRAWRRLIGELLLHEMGHALGLGESEVKDFGV